MATDEATTDKPVLPGNHGQGDATTDSKTPKNHPVPAQPGHNGPSQTNAGERS